MCPIVQGKEASGGLWEHWPDVTVDVLGISRDEINAYLQQYDAALCVFIVCESLLGVFSYFQIPNFDTMQKEDSPSHQTCGTCMEY